MTINENKGKSFQQDKKFENSDSEKEQKEKIYKIKVQHEAIKSIRKTKKS